MKKNIFLTIFIFLFPVQLLASEIFFFPDSVSTIENSEFETKLFIDTEGKNINAVDVEISVPNDLKVKDLLHGHSIITLWIERPNFSENKIRFSGIIPGGFSGVLGTGPDKAGELLTLVLESKDKATKDLEIDFSEILLNDGHGTSDEVSAKVFTYVYSENEINYQRMIDKTAPDEFEPEIVRSDLFDNKFVLFFSTRDGESGISHFEIKEGENDWEVSESPYLIKDQSLRSKILVKAIDKSGNLKIVEAIVGEDIKTSLSKNGLLLIIIILITVLVLWIARKRKRR